MSSEKADKPKTADVVAEEMRAEAEGVGEPHKGRQARSHAVRSIVSPSVDLASGERDEEPGLAERNAAYEAAAQRYEDNGQDEAAAFWRAKMDEPWHQTSDVPLVTGNVPAVGAGPSGSGAP